VSNSSPDQASAAPAPPCVAAPSHPAADTLPAAALARWFNEEVHPHEGPLRGYLRGRYPGVQDVDDVVQESFLRIWKARLARPILSSKTFLFQIARHLVVDKVRRERVARTESLEDFALQNVMDDRPDPAELLSYHEKVSLVADALAELPDRCWEIFILRKFKDVPQREIAFKLRIAEATVESQVARGMKLMERHLRARGINGFIADEK